MPCLLCLLCLPYHAAAGLLYVCAIDLRPSLSCPFQLFLSFSRIAFFLIVLIVYFGFQLESGADFEHQVINSVFLNCLVPFSLSVVNIRTNLRGNTVIVLLSIVTDTHR